MAPHNEFAAVIQDIRKTACRAVINRKKQKRQAHPRHKLQTCGSSESKRGTSEDACAICSDG